jgi:hypothetical protein
MAAAEHITNEVGIPEVATGAVAGAATAAMVPIMFHKLAPATIKKVTIERLAQHIINHSHAIAEPLFYEFTKLKPPPLEAIALKAWDEEAKTYVRNSPALQDVIKKETQKALTASANLEELSKASMWEKPLLAFNSLSTVGKVGVGAIALASAFGVGYAVNRWRNGDETHVERLERERRAPKSHTLADM